ncbi:hypothetical protein llap_9371 [Limosa lapponica baueri]|uniref:Uncharacterized protein n=1 Tax=Limosa lapponica baueri TaxID=1758121 RepID=A0A2I0U2K8_LIMLA|nr:hypothetical protein llap_9371 [Limosa lapponica baueri]
MVVDSSGCRLRWDLFLVPSLAITTFEMSQIKRSVSDSEALLSGAARSWLLLQPMESNAKVNYPSQSDECIWCDYYTLLKSPDLVGSRNWADLKATHSPHQIDHHAQFM